MRPLLPLLALPLLACHSSSGAAPADAGPEGDAPPPWLHDAGLTTRAPVKRPLRDLCGFASNPGDLPLDAAGDSTAKRAGYFNAASDLGLRMIRRDFAWNEIEPVAGQYQWATYDALVAQAAAAGVQILATLHDPPTWAAADPDAAPTLGGESPPRNPADYAAFAGAVAARYRGKLAGLEIWNEPSNGFRFWQPTLGGDPAAYGALLSAAHDAIHAADPQARVLFGGCTFDPQLIPGAVAFQSGAFAATPGLSGKFEAMALHPYDLYPPSTAPEYGSQFETPLPAKIEEELWLLGQNGAADAPVWLTEIGWPVTADVDESAQARDLVRATILAAASGADAVFWYTLRDGPNPDASPPEDAFGLLHNDGQFQGGDAGATESTPKRSYLALKALLRTVGDRWPDAASPSVPGLPTDGHAVHFAGAGSGAVIVLWTEGSTGAVTLPGVQGSVVDVLGASKGALGASVAVGPDPVYVVTP